MEIFLIISIMIILLAIGMPVAFSLAFSGLFGLIFFFGIQASVVVAKVMYESLNDFILVAVPLFILLSQLLSVGGIGEKLYGVANTWVRHLPGGLAIATVLSCAIFAAISGSSAATAATIGIVAIPSMISRGYDERFTLGLVAAGGTLGILIPPSIPMILFGAIVGESTGKLFISGIIPGIILTGVFIGFAIIYCRKGARYIPQPPASWKERFQAIKTSFWALMLPPLIIVTIYTGLATPTEAAGVGCLFAFILCVFVYRSLDWRQFKQVLLEASSTSCMILMIITGALIYGNVLTSLRIPQMLADMVVTYQIGKWPLIILLNILFLIMGCFLEVISIMLITLPVFFPTLVALQIDPFWFNVILVINMELALITPPVGLNLFVIQGISNRPLSMVVKGVFPFMILMALVLILIILVPSLSTWLPSLSK